MFVAISYWQLKTGCSFDQRLKARNAWSTSGMTLPIDIEVILKVYFGQVGALILAISKDKKARK